MSLKKSFFLLAACCFGLASFSILTSKETVAEVDVRPVAASVIPWYTDFTKAKMQAEKESKALFVLFTGSDWCPWCIKLDKELLSQQAFIKQVGDKLVFVKVDFPRSQTLDPKQQEQNDRLAKEFRIGGFPTIVILDKSGVERSRLFYKTTTPDLYAQDVLTAAYGK